MTQKNLLFRIPDSEADYSDCAKIMATTEPWITLKRSYNESLEILTDSTQELYLGFVDNQLIGFLLLDMQGAFTGFIKSIAIIPKWRNHGFGSQFIAFAEERIFNERPNVFMTVSSFNTKAQILYQRLGYKTIGELKNYIISGHSEIILRKTISSLADFKKNKS